PRVDAERVSLLQMVVEHRGEQRVRARDRVKVAREMQVDVVHRDDLRVPTARRAAFHSEHGAQARLTDAQRDLMAHSPERLREADRHGALALAGGCWVGRRDDDESSTDWTLRHLERNLRLVFAVEIELVALEPEFR